MLNNHTYYSLRYGCFSEEELLQMAVEHGYRTLALTDVNNTSACLNFLRMAPRYGIHPVVGVAFHRGLSGKPLYVGLARTNEGFYHLNAFLSQYLQGEIELPDRAPPLPDVHFVYPLERFYPEPAADLERLLEDLSLTENEWVGVRAEELDHKLSLFRRIPVDRAVIWHPVTFRNKTDFNVHRILRAIDANVLLSQENKEHIARPQEQMVHREALCQPFHTHPQLIANTRELLESCRVAFEFDNPEKTQNQRSYTGSVKEDEALLLQLALDGLQTRYGEDVTQEIIDRVHKELALVRHKNFVSYFLINWDIVEYARRKGYFYIGRGSGANSIIAYLLGITDVDPIALDLYFERFINLHRQSPPDFDLDFSWKDRQDVTRYIFERFPNVALLATYNTFRYRGAVREVAKVFGLPRDEIDRLARGQVRGFSNDKHAQLVLRYAALLQGKPNHLGIHSSGIVISERPFHWFSATFIPPKGFPTVQYDMVIAEDVGHHKFDILGQRGLPKIKDALRMIRENNPGQEAIDIRDIPRFIRDEGVRSLLSKGDCMGCFYIESPAMRMLLRKLGTDDYPGLVAASSIIRPGVARSGMMDEYILRSKYPDRAAKRAHPRLLELLPETYGVMVYQEDVIRVAHHFAGLTLGEADVLRRAMSGKFRSRKVFDDVRRKFFSNCAERGYTLKDTQEIWRQIESFAGYAFAKGHSASYAVESYQCLYLKAHWPLEYMVAVINNGGGFYSAETYVREARRWGGRIHLPCVQRGAVETTIEGRDIYLGLGMIQGLREEFLYEMVEERRNRGPYKHLEDFMRRTNTGIESLAVLIRVGALRFTGLSKPALLWQAHFFVRAFDDTCAQPLLFEPEVRTFALPGFDASTVEDAYDQMELLGFPLCNPFELLPERTGEGVSATDLPVFLRREVIIYGYLVTYKVTRTSKGERMFFGTFRDEHGELFDTVHFPDVARRYPFRGRGIYRMSGKVTVSFDFYSIEVHTLSRVHFMQDPRTEGQTQMPVPAGRQSERRGGGYRR